MSKKVNSIMTLAFLTLFGSIGSEPEIPLRQISAYLDNEDDITETDWGEDARSQTTTAIIGIRG